MSGRAAYGRAAYGGPSGLETVPPGQQTLPPPIPGGTTTWNYRRHPALNYGYRAYGGGSIVPNYPGGGISLRPVAERGIMEITAWWPDAALLSLIRVTRAGAATPVRGANPVPTAGVTRRNYATNPSVEIDRSGWLADAGNPTLLRTSVGAAPRGGFYLLATAAAAGSNGVTVPTAIPPGTNLTVGFDLWLKARPTGFTVTVNWADAAGGALTPTVVSLSAADINRSVAEVAQASAQFARQAVSVNTPINGVTATLKLTATGMPLSTTNIIGIDGVTVERDATDGSYFDGSTYGGLWSGATGLSVSVLAPLLKIEDGECPTDQPVSYQLVNPTPVAGGVMESPLVVLPSNGTTWLTHPGDPAHPRKIIVDKVPVETEDVDQGKFLAIGARYRVVVSAKQRAAPSGKIGFYALTWDERDDLVSLFADLQPVLLRAPSEYGYRESMWLALGAQEQDPEDRLAYHDARLLSFPFDVVEAPAA